MIRLFVIVFMMLAFLFAGCSATKNITSNVPQVIKTKVSSGDYLDDGTVLAAFMWEDGGYSEMQFYPAKVLTPASDETKGEAQVQSLRGSPDVSNGEKHWTKNVIYKSHPAKKDELKKGMVILYCGTYEYSRDELKKEIWRRGVVVGLDELYKNRVKVRYIWNAEADDSGDSESDVPLSNIRIADDPQLPMIERFM